MLNYSLITIIVFWVNLVFGAIQYPNCSVEHNTPLSWSVDCSSLNLDFFPQHLLEHPVRNLTFVHNNLNSSIKFQVWKDLQHLNVAYNKLTYITDETFNGLEKLIYLNISYNEIKKLNADAFHNLPIRILDISGNQNLGKNSEYLENALEPLYRGLRKLYIADLNLHDMRINFFDRADVLSLVDISNNYLKYLPTFPKSLKIVDISNNSFNTLTIEPFYHCREIYTFIAENNKNLTEVQADTFHGMAELKYVSFKGCTKFDNIYYGTFHFNRKLQYLSIANCNFKTLPIILKHIFFRVDVVDLQDNPWHCDATIKWFYVMDMPTNITKNLRCASPHEMPLFDFYEPKHHHEILKIILGFLVVLVFVFFGVGLFFAYEMERKRKLAHPYMPLGRGAPVSNPIYISTVM
uniref:Putative leucine-rich repeat protein n=1 Tax=Panstrongylus lignarius TaxID=156445 RepID=A0A224XHH1_9HEMI